MKVSESGDLVAAEHPINLDILKLLEKLEIPKEKWYEYTLSEMGGMIVQNF